MDLTERFKVAFRAWRWTPEAQRAIAAGYQPEPADLAAVAQQVVDDVLDELNIIDLRDCADPQPVDPPVGS